MWSFDISNNLISCTHTEPIIEHSTTADSNSVNVLLMMMTDSFTFIEANCYCRFCKWSNNVKLLIVPDNAMPNVDIVFLSEFLNMTAGVNAVLGLLIFVWKMNFMVLVRGGKNSLKHIDAKVVELHKLTF